MNQPAPDNRTRLLDVAERLFATRGFEATSVRDIVREAGMTNPMLYYYFGSKEDLFVHLVRERFAYMRGLITDRLVPCTTMESTLRAWGEVVMEVMGTHPMTVRMLFALTYGDPHAALLQALRVEHVALRTIVDGHLQGIAPGIAPQRIHFAMFLFRGAMDFLFHVEPSRLADIDLDGLLDALIPRVLAVLTDGHPVPEQDFDPEHWCMPAAPDAEETP
jgi:AcrR family transcriptional regulator